MFTRSRGWHVAQGQAYGQQMPTVYLRADPKGRNRFHRDPECHQLRKKSSRGDDHELVARDLEDVYARPCLACYPDAPRVRIFKAYCATCDTKYACPHNGGVPVLTPWNPYHKTERLLWLWPDNNHLRQYHQPTG